MKKKTTFVLSWNRPRIKLYLKNYDTNPGENNRIDRFGTASDSGRALFGIKCNDDFQGFRLAVMAR